MNGAAAAIVHADGSILLVKENYERRRYGFPGGAVEPGETPLDAVVRETREETGADVDVEHVVGVYRLDTGFTAIVFRCSIVAGEPAVPGTGEIDEVGWFRPDALPAPITNLLHHAVADVVADARGIVRDRLPRIN